MINKAFVQRGDHGEIMSEPSYVFWDGARRLGLDIEFFVPSQLDELKLTMETMVHGGVGTVRRAFDRLGVEQPRLDGMPPEAILPFYGRRVWATTMAEVRQGYEDNRFFFIKPLRRHKAFSGYVTSGAVGSLIRTAGIADDFEILASDPVRFDTEYRLFVHEGKILDARLYLGSYRKVLDWSVADAAIEAYEDAPVAYSLDLGLTDDGRTLVVELNDCFALGSYGMPSIPYARMVVDRWSEIVGVEY